MQNIFDEQMEPREMTSSKMITYRYNIVFTFMTQIWNKHLIFEGLFFYRFYP